MKTKLASFTDSLLLRLVLFFALFVWASFTLKPIPAALSAFAAAVSIYGLLSKRRLAPPPDREFSELVLTQLTVMPEAEIEAFFLRALKGMGAESTGGCILVKAACVCPVFSPEPIGAERASAACRAACALGRSRIVFLTAAGLKPDAVKFVSNAGFRVSVKEGEAVYRLLRRLGAFPAIKVRPPEKKRRRFSAAEAFSGDKLTKYLFASAVLFAGAYLLPYPIYYLIAASACLIAAVLCFVSRLKVGGR